MSNGVEEYLDVADANDNVIGRMARSEVHARGLMHRAVSIFVFDDLGRLLVHQRSATKLEFPLKWTSSASGHVASGETYDETAPRELEEELGITAPVSFLMKFRASPATANEHTALYETIACQELRPDPGEIADLRWFDLKELSEAVRQHPDDFTPPFHVLFGWYAQNRTR